MCEDRSKENFEELAAGFLANRISRRHFIDQAAKLGISAALLSRIVFSRGYADAADSNLVDSAPDYPNESPITKERIAFLKAKPYKSQTINVLVLGPGGVDRKSTRLNSSHSGESRMPSSA